MEQLHSKKNFHPKQGHDYLLDPQNRNGGKYRVLETQNDPQTGFQAMAVAPVDKDGNPDTTQVTIAYAGTNPTDIEDIKTDIFSVGLGMRTHQMMQADIFANYIKTTYNPADLSFTGHSLGGYEAMSIAGK